MAGNDRSGRSLKSKEKRDQVISLRISKSDLELIDHYCYCRKSCGFAHYSRVDVILIALKNIDNEVFIKSKQ